ncbi:MULTISPECIES: hypothetical protein [unclassified Streptomyces]|uniref:hypothetical protein n=1 Tax=unclassified Streptomyces TaxID=2593676 RepID=UPI00093C4569|nr:hypothetical protein [Streptomyces sp. CB02058]
MSGSITKARFIGADQVRDMVHNRNADGFDSLYRRTKAVRPRRSPLRERGEISRFPAAIHSRGGEI